MPLPDQSQRELIWKNRLKTMYCEDLDLGELSKKSDGLSGAVIEQVCLDARRDAVINGDKTVSVPKLYRRLYLAQALLESVTLSTYEDEIRWLRSKDHKAFSIRVLAELYGISTRAISNLIKESIPYEQKGFSV